MTRLEELFKCLILESLAKGLSVTQAASPRAKKIDPLGKTQQATRELSDKEQEEQAQALEAAEWQRKAQKAIEDYKKKYAPKLKPYEKPAVPADTMSPEQLKRIDAKIRQIRNVAGEYLRSGDKAAFSSLIEIADGLYEKYFGKIDESRRT